MVTCFNNREILQENLLKSLGEQHNTDFELIAIDNTVRKFSSITSALNYGGQKATGDYIMFVHQDIYLCGENWLDVALSLLNKLPEVGAAGVAGVDSNGIGVGFILDRGRYWGRPLNGPLPVQTLDEQLVIIPRVVFERIQFDEHFDFHLYGADYCLSAKNLGLSVYVLPLFVEHNSLAIETLQASNIKNQEKILFKKHSKDFKTIRKTTGTLGRRRDILRRSFTSFISDFLIVASITILKLRKITLDQKTILDIGCLPIEQNPMKKRVAKKLSSVGVSHKRRYLVISKKLGIHDDYVVADPEKLPFKVKSFDIAFFAGSIEYLSKEKGEHALENSEKIAKDTLIRVPFYGSSTEAMHPVIAGDFILEKSQWRKKDFEAKKYRSFVLGPKRILPCSLYAYKRTYSQENIS